MLLTSTSLVKQLTRSAIGTALLLCVWLLIALWVNKPYLLPSPTLVYHTFAHSYATYANDFLLTFFEAASGLLGGVMVGGVLALLAYYSLICRRLIMPLSVIAKVLPLVAIAPLLAVWLGPNFGTRILMAILVCFFPILQGVYQGLDSGTPAQAEAYITVLGANKRKQLMSVRGWYATPHIIAALKVAAPLAVVGAVVAEFVQLQSGLGGLHHSRRDEHRNIQALCFGLSNRCNRPYTIWRRFSHWNPAA